jgi:small subunit ribosomal protein S3Ae
MAVGKNKRLTKSKKGAKGKKIIDPFKNKQRYEVRAPSYFATRSIGSTICTKSMGNRVASDNLKGRVFQVCLADLKKDEEQAYRHIKLRVEDVQDKRVLTNFYGLQLTTDKLKSLIRKWQTTIEAYIDVKTQDGYVLRVFVIAFTAKMPNQAKKTHYAQSSKIRLIRRKISTIVRDHITTASLKQVVEKFINNVIEKQIENASRSIYPLNNIFIRKVKMLKWPKFDLNKLMEIHVDTGAEDLGTRTAEPVQPTESAAETAQTTETPAATAE